MTGSSSIRDWKDFADVPDAARWVAVLPLAATEQHGPHLPVTTDVDIADAYLARVRAMLPEDLSVVCLPVQAIGISTEHIDYPGTQTLAPDVAIRDWIALGAQVAARGIRRLVMVSSHGGNGAAMAIVAQELRAHQRMLAVTTSWSRFGMPDGLFEADEVRHGIHGGAVETSIMLAHTPHLVRRDKIADFTPASVAMAREFRWLNVHRPAPFAWQAQDLHPSGVAGDATKASAAKGEHLLEHGARAFCELLADVARFDLAMLREGPGR